MADYYPPPGGGGGATPGYIHLQHQEASGTAGGTATSGSWETRTLNTEVADTGANCALSSNQFTLAAGTYEIHAFLSHWRTDAYSVRLQNVTDTATVLAGIGGVSDSTNDGPMLGAVQGRFTIGASKALELQSRVTTTVSTSGYGIAASFGVEVYVDVVLFKVA